MSLNTSSTVAGGKIRRSLEVLLEEEDSEENELDGLREKAEAAKFCL